LRFTTSDSVQTSLTLIREGRSGALSSLAFEKNGWPYVSMVTYATDVSGRPIFLFSDLAAHCQNVSKDTRASLLIEKASVLSNPQMGSRVSLLGEIQKTMNEHHASRFLARHPQANLYSSFSDFNFYRMSVTDIHFVGGFAQSKWVRGEDIIVPQDTVQFLEESEIEILNHMNSDHPDTIDLYANFLCKKKGSGWKMVGIDCDGVDLMRKGRISRLNFNSRVVDPDSVREEMVRLSVGARKLMIG